MAPPWLRFEILSPSEFAVDRGTRIDYWLRIRAYRFVGRTRS